MAGVVASDLTVAVWFGAAGVVLVAFATVIVALVVDVIGEGDAVGDVQRFSELSAAGRYSLLPHRPLLSDPDGATSVAISRLLAEKEQARRALWSSREPNGSRPPRIPEVNRASRPSRSREQLQVAAEQRNGARLGADEKRHGARAGR